MPSRRELANAIRALSMDAVQQAKSGHPGAPMGMADIAEVLWGDFLSHNPANPSWANRDRFVLSNGHGSMLLYSLLWDSWLCYVVVRYAMLWSAKLSCALLKLAGSTTLCYATPSYAMLCCAMLCCAMLRYAALCSAMLCYARVC